VGGINQASFHFDLSTFELYAGAIAGAAFSGSARKAMGGATPDSLQATPSSFILLMAHGNLSVKVVVRQCVSCCSQTKSLLSNHLAPT
jgi:hypothetical protein